MTLLSLPGIFCISTVGLGLGLALVLEEIDTYVAIAEWFTMMLVWIIEVLLDAHATGAVQQKFD